jgi:homoserine kinase
LSVTKEARGAEFTAFAPATVANVAVGFDIMGFAAPLNAGGSGPAGDTVTVRWSAQPGVRILKIEGPDGVAMAGLPMEPEKNTATAGLLRLIQEQAPGSGLEVEIRKGIPLGSGLGGSAASAAAALFAAQALLRMDGTSLSLEQLLEYAVDGESVASGSRHADNVAPSLFGGIILVLPSLRVERLPVPAGLSAAVVHPDVVVETRAARAILRKQISLSEHVRQSSRLALLIHALHTGRLGLLKEALLDELIEPQRKQLIPGFDSVRSAALGAGALGCSISGSGPSVFALCDGEATAARVAEAMRKAFAGAGLVSRALWGPIPQQGARLR